MKIETVEQMLDAIKQRSVSFGYGIGVASGYYKAVAPCIADQQCFNRMLSGVTPIQWEEGIKRAESLLTYCLDDSLDTKSLASSTETMKSILSEIKTPRSVELPKHAALVFKSFLTTDKRDRDSDILDPMGAEIDVKMPLLWMHLQPMPIGKYLGTIEQNSQFVKCASVICDVSDVSRDAIKMVEANILRISHGFRPKQFEPLPSQPGDQLPGGFHVKKYNVIEKSVVSVPSNDGATIDAIATVVSRKQLRSELVKSFAQKHYGLRDTANQFALGEIPKVPLDINISINGQQLNNEKAACGCGTVTKGSDAIHGNPPNPTGDGAPNAGLDTDGDANEPPGTDKAGDSKCSKCGGKMKDGKCEKCETQKDTTADAEKLRESINSLIDSIFEPSNGKSANVAIKSVANTAVKGVKDGYVEWEKTGERAIVIHSVPDGVEPALDLKQVKMYVELTGSYEWKRRKLESSLKKYLLSQPGIDFNPTSPDYDYAYIEAMFDDHAIISISGKNRKLLRIDWSTDIKGTPTWSGKPKEVDVSTSITSKSGWSPVATKQFRVPGQSEQAMGRVETVLKTIQKSGDAGMHALASSAIESLSKLRTDDSQQPEEVSIKSLEAGVLKSLFNAGKDDIECLKRLTQAFQMVVEGVENEILMESLQ